MTASMEPRVLKTENERLAALREAERLVAVDPNLGSREADRLELLTLLIEDYEKRAFPFEEVDPIDAIEFRMTEQGLKQKDLVPILGSKSRVSEILARKRPLTVQMIRALSMNLGIPAESLIAEPIPLQARKEPALENIDWKKFPVKEM